MTHERRRYLQPQTGLLAPTIAAPMLCGSGPGPKKFDLSVRFDEGTLPMLKDNGTMERPEDGRAKSSAEDLWE